VKSRVLIERYFRLFNLISHVGFYIGISNLSNGNRRKQTEIRKSISAEISPENYRGCAFLCLTPPPPTNCKIIALALTLYATACNVVTNTRDSGGGVAEKSKARIGIEQ